MPTQAGAAPVASDRSSSTVSAVVLVRPGTPLPLAVRGGTVVSTFPHVGSELVRAPMSSLTALAHDVRVLGVSPDRAGRVAGDSSSSGTGVPGPAAPRREPREARGRVPRHGRPAL